MAMIAARIHQALRSSMAAQVMTSVPRGVSDSPRSRKIRASTGNAVILSEIPMNRAKAKNETPSGA